MMPMGQPFGSQSWGQELGERVWWLLDRGQSTAELRLNPAELGSLEIRVRMEKEGASVSFVVQSASVREAVEGTLPRLRELLAEAGVSLGSVDVSERSAGQAGDDRRGDGGAGASAPNPLTGGNDSAPTGPAARRGEGLVDTYV
jgi:flagellar hook-length control protein FliK